MRMKKNEKKKLTITMKVKSMKQITNKYILFGALLLLGNQMIAMEQLNDFFQGGEGDDGLNSTDAEVRARTRERMMQAGQQFGEFAGRTGRAATELAREVYEYGRNEAEKAARKEKPTCALCKIFMTIRERPKLIKPKH